MRLSFFIAKRYFLARKGAFVSFITAISVLGVAVGVAALIIALSISTGFTETMKRKLNEFYADLNVMGFSAEMDEKSCREAISAIEKDKDVRGVTPIVLGIGLLSSADLPGVPKVARVLGIEPESHGKVVNLMKYVKGSGELASFDDGCKGAIIGKDLAMSLGLEEGDTVDLLVPRMTMSPFGPVPKLVTLRITGILDSGYYLYDNEFLYLDLAFSRKLFTRGGAHAVEVRLSDPGRTGEAKRRIEGLLGKDYRVMDLMETNREFFKALKMERLLLFIAIGLIVVVAALNIVSTLILMVMEKVKDIGLLRSVGASSRQIRAIFLIEGLLIGVIGTVLGDILGVTAAYFLDKYKVIPLSLEVYPIPYVPFETGIGQVAAVSIFAFLVSLAATIYPSGKAARLLPLEALRYE